MWMNEYDVERALETALRNELPNMTEGVYRLMKLVNWTNGHSDGWPYWQKPSNAARKLMELIQTIDPFAGGRWGSTTEDIDRAELNKAYQPIKAFLTRQGIDHGEIFDGTTFESIGR